MPISVDYTEMDCEREGCPDRNRLTSHYHCPHCNDPQPTSMLGHHVGGDRPDARMICDPAERSRYLRETYGS